MLLFASLYVFLMFQRSSIKNVFLQIFRYSQETLKCQTLFSTKMYRFSLQIYYKEDSDTDVFLWILRNFQVFFLPKSLQIRSPPADCLCVLHLFLKFWLKRLFKWLSSISETVTTNLVPKLSGCRNRYQHIVI